MLIYLFKIKTMKIYDTCRIFHFITLITIVLNFEIIRENNKCSDILIKNEIPLETNKFYIESYEIKGFLPKEYQNILVFKELLIKHISANDLNNMLLKNFFFSENNISCSIVVNTKNLVSNLRRHLSSTLNCSHTSYYSALFAMDLPTGSNMTANSNNSACNCIGNLVNSVSLENKIFCGCPNGELLKSDGTTCITLKDCNEQSKVVIDNFCVDCVTGSTFNSITNRCVCASGSWRPNYCNPAPEIQTPKKTGFKYNNDPMCAKNDVVHTISYNSTTDPKLVKNILLSSEMSLFVSSCNMVGTANVILTINGIPANFITNFNFNIGCSGANHTKYLTFQPNDNNIYSLEITCASSQCSGSIILLTEIKSVTFMSLNQELILENAANALQNTFNIGLTTSANNQGLLWNMKKGDVFVISLGKHSGLTQTFVLRIGNLPQTLTETIINITTAGYYYYNIPQDDDYYIKIGCVDENMCLGFLQLTVQKTKNGIAHFWEKQVSFSYTITSVNTENATVNTKNIGCTSAVELAEYEYLVNNLFRGDYIEITLPNVDTYVAIINTDLANLNLEVQPQLISGSYIFSKSIIAQGTHCLKFGCKTTTANCSGTVTLKVRKTVTRYLEGTYKAFSGIFTSTAKLGEVGNAQYDNLKDLKVFDSIYVETLPSSYLNYSKITSLSINGGGNYDNFPGLFGRYSKLYLPIEITGGYVISMACVGSCTSKYVYSIYTFPTIAGYDSTALDCLTCPVSSININNVCTPCSQLTSPIGFVYSLSDRKYLKGNDCSDYPELYIYFNKAGKYYECKPGFTPKMTVSPHECECNATIVNGECTDPAYCTADNGANRNTSVTLLRNSSGMCQCSDTTKCYDSTAEYVCITGSIGKINNTDGKSCSSLCVDSAKCYDPITYTCKNKIVNSLEFFKSTITGGVCIPNTCTISNGAVLVLTTNPLVSRSSDGSCICTDGNSCIDTSTNSCITRTAEYIVSPVCTTIACSKPDAVITQNDNKLKIEMTIPDGTTNLKVDFTDPDNVLAGVDFDRFYMQVQLTDSFAFKFLQGTKSNSNAATITVTEAQINQFCALVDESEIAKGRKCYFRAVVADKCKDTLDHVVYNHFAMRIINSGPDGIYIVDEISVVPDDLEVDYCRWLASCYISTRFTYDLKFCDDQGTTCVEISPGYKYKRDDVVFIEISFFHRSGLALMGKEFSVISVMTKLYNNLNQEIDTPERTVVLTNQPLSLDNRIYFNFNLTPDLLYYDNENLISSNVRLLIIIKVEDQVMLRYLQLNIAQSEIIPQIGGLIAINIDYEDALNYQTSASRKKMIIIIVISVLCSLVAILLVTVGILLCLFVFNNTSKTIPTTESQISTPDQDPKPHEFSEVVNK